eukprot:1443466-Pyramimonas_sp.AAC.1
MCTPQCLRTPATPVYTIAAAATTDVCATTPVYTAMPAYTIVHARVHSGTDKAAGRYRYAGGR